MQRLAISLSRSFKLLQPSLQNDLKATILDYRWNAVIQGCLSDCRNYSTSMVNNKQQHRNVHKFTREDFHSQLESKQVVDSLEVLEDYQSLEQFSKKMTLPRKKAVGENISSRDKSTFLLNELKNISDSREAVYSTLDGWVAWEKSFPLVSLKRILITLEKQEQWHRVIQILKWMLSKGQGRTRGTYAQLIRALEKDHRAEEAHRIWVKKIGSDLHSVPWHVCHLMISIYYRNNMPRRLVKLFEALESFDRKPPCKSIIQKVADAYEILELSEEKTKVLDKYSSLFSQMAPGSSKRSPRVLNKRRAAGPAETEGGDFS